jgi:hypothetical protein
MTAIPLHRSHAELLNEQIGQKLFAERLDEFGLPVDGWALPTLTAYDEPDAKRARFVMGTFRIQQPLLIVNGEPVFTSIKKSAEKFLPYSGRCEDFGDIIAKCKEELLAMLVEELKGE